MALLCATALAAARFTPLVAASGEGSMGRPGLGDALALEGCGTRTESVFLADPAFPAGHGPPGHPRQRGQGHAAGRPVAHTGPGDSGSALGDPGDRGGRSSGRHDHPIQLVWATVVHAALLGAFPGAPAPAGPLSIAGACSHQPAGHGALRLVAPDFVN